MINEAVTVKVGPGVESEERIFLRMCSANGYIYFWYESIDCRIVHSSRRLHSFVVKILAVVDTIGGFEVGLGEGEIALVNYSVSVPWVS